MDLYIVREMRCSQNASSCTQPHFWPRTLEMVDVVAVAGELESLRASLHVRLA